ncbi:hypothetical protein BS50DRAFT_671340 [Corynespora cassiicola Philippines]|uniref:Uncharacterized protein n=1 Tax=Corynespora cassiicola Philippines TaxID=1448308 RepID=A0A2T2PBT8_CORCC|nr:hypothetical protein BS50DRAFT_671340 [Corynespora cassiicola Philippines]
MPPPSAAPTQSLTPSHVASHDEAESIAAAHRAHMNPPWIFVLSAFWLLTALFFVLKTMFAPLQNLSSRAGGRFFALGLPEGYAIVGTKAKGKSVRGKEEQSRDEEDARESQQRATRIWTVEEGVVEMGRLDGGERAMERKDGFVTV